MDEQNKSYGKVYDGLAAEFQDLLNQVAEHKKMIKGAKTAAKKSLYTRKINKLRPRILQLVEYMQVLIDRKTSENTQKGE